LFFEKVLCQRCFNFGHRYFECPYQKTLSAFCELCGRLGHWKFCCWLGLDKQFEAETKSKQGEKVETVAQGSVKSMTPSGGVAAGNVIADILARVSAGEFDHETDALQIPGTSSTS
jgi:hypothetical protein